jgi:hypothetical protein
MSLKMFHVVFVLCSLALTIGLSVWAFGNHQVSGRPVDLFYGIGSAISSVALVIYGWVFLKKLKHISFL